MSLSLELNIIKKGGCTAVNDCRNSKLKNKLTLINSHRIVHTVDLLVETKPDSYDFIIL